MAGAAGTIVGIFTAAESGGAIVSRREVEAVAGRGLQGDRYFDAHAGEHDPADEITLIDAASLQLAKTDHGVDFAPGEHRRNLVVEGLDLLEMVGQTVRIGAAEVAVIRDNPPCAYLRDLTGKPVLTALRRRGGVRGGIVSTGVIRLGDPVTPEP